MWKWSAGLVHLPQLSVGKFFSFLPSRHAPYSGMLPGYVAGQYGFKDFHIDLTALCARSGVTFLMTTATRIDADQRQVSLADGRVLGYSRLSIDIGSTPVLPPGISGGIAVKPIASFTERLAQLDRLSSGKVGALRLAVVGQGVGGRGDGVCAAETVWSPRR